ncbi:hypothetical protein BGX24_004432, partial [Mortierella sp. AD032]
MTPSNKSIHDTTTAGYFDMVSTSLPSPTPSPLPNNGGYNFTGLLPLSEEQVERAKAHHGKNLIAFGNDQVWYKVLFRALIHPFNILLAVLGTATFLTGDNEGGTIMFFMVFLSTALRFWQEWKSASAAKSLKSMVSTLITVTRLYSCPEHRDPTPEDVSRILNHATIRMDILIEDVVPGDWVQLSAGDLIPADVRVMESKDLFVSQAALTGEAMPVEKFGASSEAMAAWRQRSIYDEMAKSAVPANASAIPVPADMADMDATSSTSAALGPRAPTKMTVFKNSLRRSVFACFGIRRFDSEVAAHSQNEADLSAPDVCFMGTSVVSGTATVLVEKIGSETFFGSMAKELSKRRPENAFQMGVRNISWVFFGLMAVMVPPVLLINGFVHQSWTDAAL